MLHFPANVFYGVAKFILVVTASKAALATAMVLWQNMFCCNSLLRFCRVAGTEPFLLLELRLRLNLRYWVARCSRFDLCCNWRTHLPAISSPAFLVSRDGHTIFDFLKSLSLNDVSPPVFA